MSKYKINVRCKSCGAKRSLDTPIVLFGDGCSDRFCGECGEFAGLDFRVEWWLSASKWWKPWTWFRGVWMPKDGWIKPD